MQTAIISPSPKTVKRSWIRFHLAREIGKKLGKSCFQRCALFSSLIRYSVAKCDLLANADECISICVQKGFADGPVGFVALKKVAENNIIWIVLAAKIEDLINC